MGTLIIMSVFLMGALLLIILLVVRKDIKDKSKFNKIIFDEIKKHKTELDKKVKNLVWERLDNPERVYSRIYFIIAKCSLNNKSIHPRLGINDISGTKKESIFSKYLCFEILSAFLPFTNIN